MEAKKDIINRECYICENVSGYDKKSLKGSTHNINGKYIVLCCPCEDDLFDTFLKARMTKKRMLELTENLMSDERNDILDLYRFEVE